MRPLFSNTLGNVQECVAQGNHDARPGLPQQADQTPQRLPVAARRCCWRCRRGPAELCGRRISTRWCTKLHGVAPRWRCRCCVRGGGGGGQPSIMPATTCSPQLSTKPVDWHTMCTSCAVGTKLALSLVAIAEHGLLMGVCNVVVNDKPRRLTMPVCIWEGLRNMPLQSFQEDVHTWTVPPRWSIRFRASGLLQATVCPR